jgi:hypothetical protein
MFHQMFHEIGIFDIIEADFDTLKHFWREKTKTALSAKVRLIYLSGEGCNGSKKRDKTSRFS